MKLRSLAPLLALAALASPAHSAIITGHTGFFDTIDTNPLNIPTGALDTSSLFSSGFSVSDFGLENSQTISIFGDQLATGTIIVENPIQPLLQFDFSPLSPGLICFPAEGPITLPIEGYQPPIFEFEPYEPPILHFETSPFQPGETPPVGYVNPIHHFETLPEGLAPAPAPSSITLVPEPSTTLTLILATLLTCTKRQRR